MKRKREFITLHAGNMKKLHNVAHSMNTGRIFQLKED
jgi:hypothetical protein